MTLASGVFAAFLALGVLCAVISVHRCAVRQGRHAAAKYAAVLAASLAAYAAVCLWLGYGAGPQFIAAAVSMLPLRLGRRYLPAVDDMRREGPDDHAAA